MQYKTIMLELLQQNPSLHDRLQKTGQLFSTMETYTRQLKVRHELWKASLAEQNPALGAIEISAAALEIAVQEIEQALRTEYPGNAGEPHSVAAAIDFVRVHPSNK